MDLPGDRDRRRRLGDCDLQRPRRPIGMEGIALRAREFEPALKRELMRLIGAVLECPLPPLMDELDPATLSG
jgi:hypothetical protein